MNYNNQILLGKLTIYLKDKFKLAPTGTIEKLVDAIFGRNGHNELRIEAAIQMGVPWKLTTSEIGHSFYLKNKKLGLEYPEQDRFFFYNKYISAEEGYYIQAIINFLISSPWIGTLINKFKHNNDQARRKYLS